MSLPWIAYADLTGIDEVVACQESAIDHGDVKYLKVLSDFTNCLYANKRAGFPQYHMSIGHWWKSLHAEKKIYAEFVWDDPMVGLYSLLNFIKGIIIALFRKATSAARYHKAN